MSTPMSTRTATDSMTDTVGFLRLMQCFDSLFPIGAFTLSNGLETYVQRGIIKDEGSLMEYLYAYAYTLPWGDLGFAACAASEAPFYELDEIFAAVRSPSEIREGSRKLCKRFVKTQNALGGCPLLSEYEKAVENGICFGSSPIAVGLFIADAGTDTETALSMYCFSLFSQAVNHAVKLVPLSQMTGQRCLSVMLEKIPALCQRAMSVPQEDLGIGGSGFDLRAMQHETLYSRMYSS